MYNLVPEQAMKMRGLAQQLRHHAQETGNAEYIWKFERTATDLEASAERMVRTARFKARYQIAS